LFVRVVVVVVVVAAAAAAAAAVTPFSQSQVNQTISSAESTFPSIIAHYSTPVGKLYEQLT